MAKRKSREFARVMMQCKVESTTGVYEAPAGSDADLEAMDPDMTFDGTATKVQHPQSGGNRLIVPGALSGKVKLKTHLRGSATADPPKQFQLWTMAGFVADGNVLSPQGVSDVGNTGTFVLNRAGIRRVLFGVALNAKLTGEVGKPVVIEWEGTGKRGLGPGTAPSDTAQVAPVFLPGNPPVLKGVTFEVGGKQICMPGFELDLKNDVQLVQCMTDESGYSHAQAFRGDPTLSLKPEATGLTADDWFQMYEEGEEFTLNVEIVCPSGDSILMAAPRMQLQEPPKDEEGNKVYRHAVSFELMDTDDPDFLTITYVPVD